MFKFFLFILMLAGDIAYLFEKFPKLKVYSKTAIKYIWIKTKDLIVKVWNKIFKKKK